MAQKSAIDNKAERMVIQGHPEITNAFANAFAAESGKKLMVLRVDATDHFEKWLWVW